jgi:DegV family protein with EDD domain
MSNIVILAESGSDLPIEIVKRYGIVLVPMHVTLGNVTLEDGSFPVEEIYNYYAEHKELPKTSGCSPQDFIEIFDIIHNKWPDKHILHLAYSAVTTCSYQSALIAAEGRDYVTSIDTRQVSAGQGAIVTQIAKILEDSPDISMSETIEIVNNFCRQARMSFIPESLEYLKAGGRVSNAVFLGGRLLNIHPSIEIEKGYLVAKKKYRGRMERVTVKLLEDFTQRENLMKDQIWLLWSLGMPNEVKTIVEMKANELGYKKITWIKTGCVITSHAGPGAFGIAGFSNCQEDN